MPPPVGRARRTPVRTAIAAALLAAVSLGGCKRAHPGVRVEVCTPTGGVFAIDVEATPSGDSPSTTRVTAPDGGEISFPASFNVELRRAGGGLVDLCVTLRDAASADLGAECGTVVVARGEVADLPLAIAVGTCPNGAIDPGEECEPSTAGAPQTCEALGWSSGGDVACGCDCLYDITACSGPPAPAPRTPANGAEIGSVHRPGSLRPSFSWTIAGGAVGYFLEYATDTGFATDATCTEAALPYVPADDLPVSAAPPVGRRWYWHVRACRSGVDGCAVAPAGGADCSAWSAAWYVDLGRTARDLDGDAYADAVAGAPGADPSGTDSGKAYVYRGGPGASFDPTPDLVIDGSGASAASAHLGAFIAQGCDFDGDGFGDVAIGVPDLAAGGRVLVYRGGTTLDGAADVNLGGAPPATGVRAAACAGDVDGDGLDDLLLGDETADTAQLFRGDAATLVAAAPVSVMTGVPGERFGASLAGGDVDCDGHADVIVGARSGHVHVYRWMDATGQDIAYALVPEFGAAVLAADFDADGFADLAVGAPGLDLPGSDPGRIFVYHGRSGPLPDVADETLDVSEDLFGISISAGDVDGDGHADLVAGAPTPERVSVFAGGGPRLGPAAVSTLSSPCRSDGFAGAVSAAGDLNDDGYADILVGDRLGALDPTGACPCINQDYGRVLVYFGGVPIDTSPRAMLFAEAQFDMLGTALGDAPAPPVPSAPSIVLAGATAGPPRPRGRRAPFRHER